MGERRRRRRRTLTTLREGAYQDVIIPHVKVTNEVELTLKVKAERQAWEEESIHVLCLDNISLLVQHVNKWHGGSKLQLCNKDNKNDDGEEKEEEEDEEDDDDNNNSDCKAQHFPFL